MTNDDHTGTGVPAREGGADSLSAARSVPLPGPPQPRPKSRTKAALLVVFLAAVVIAAIIGLHRLSP